MVLNLPQVYQFVSIVRKRQIPEMRFSLKSESLNCLNLNIEYQLEDYIFVREIRGFKDDQQPVFYWVLVLYQDLYYEKLILKVLVRFHCSLLEGLFLVLALIPVKSIFEFDFWSPLFFPLWICFFTFFSPSCEPTPN